MVDHFVDLNEGVVPSLDGDILGKRAGRARPTVRRVSAPPEAVARTVERRRSFIATLDRPAVIVVAILLAIGLMMVYSTTFDWSYQLYGTEATIFLQHARNTVYGIGLVVGLILVDYRRLRRFAILFLVVTFALLIGVLLFGDDTFGAKRSFFNGSYQPGELAELIIIVYIAAWLSSKSIRIRSITQGLLPFGILVGVMCYLVILQPDISTAAMIFMVSGIMFFLAGANMLHLLGVGLLVAVVGVGLLSTQRLGYAQDRVESYLSGAADLTQAGYHVQQAVVAFRNGLEAGPFGVGLGLGRQKYGFLPAPHTDSIFAVIGEELGIFGAMMVIVLYMILVFRGFQIARRAQDPFGALLASGITIWIAAKALLNIAVMTAVVPATGAPLPYISFGGSSLMVMMAGTGLLLSIARVSIRESVPERRNTSANYDLSGGDRRGSVSRARRSRSHSKPSA